MAHQWRHEGFMTVVLCQKKRLIASNLSIRWLTICWRQRLITTFFDSAIVLGQQEVPGIVRCVSVLCTKTGDDREADTDTDRILDEKRIQWQADDLILNRPALSRWHPDFQVAYEQFIDQ